MNLKRSAIHNHSEMSNTKNLDCIIKLKDLIFTANEMGFKSIVLTEHECLSGHLQAREIEKDVQKINPNFKVGLGNEIYLVKDREKENGKKYYHFILIAKNKKGHHYIRELSSRAWENSYWEKGQHRTATLYSDIEEIVKEKGNLIATSACIGSYYANLVLKYIQTNDEDYKYEIDGFLNWCINIFGKEDFYIELQAARTEDQIKYNKKSIEIARFYDLKCIISDDTHYLKKEDRTIHEAYLQSRDAEREVGDFYEACYLKTDEDLLERLSYFDIETIEELCRNTIEITDKLEHYELTHDIIVPQRNIPKFEIKGIFNEYYEQYEYLQKFSYSDFEQDRFLLSELEKGFIEKKQEFNDVNINRINIELRTLWEVSEKLNQRISSYYNLAQEVIDIMWDDNKGNSLVGISRGSGSGFYICYLMDITQMNPIEHDLCEWRHLN